MILYLILGLIAVITICISIYARKKISECKSEEEKRITKAKWQLICGLLGMACVIVVVVLIITMFL